MPVPFARYVPRLRAWLASAEGGTASRRLSLASVFLTALGVRASFVSDHPVDLLLVSNMEFIDARARHLVQGSSVPVDTFTPVGYPALVALAHAVTAQSYAVIGALQVLLGAATCVLGQTFCRRLTRSSPLAWLVGMALALYLPLVVYTGFLLTETVFAFLVTALAHALVGAIEAPSRARDVAAGLLFGAAATVRPNLLLAAPFLVVYGLLQRHRGAPRATWGAPFRLLALSAPLLAVVAIHNSSLVGRPTGLATNGGVNFLLGHCECRGISFPPGFGVGFVSGHQNRIRYSEVLPSPRSALDEPYYYARAFTLLRERPALVARAVLNVTDGLALTGLGELPDQPYYPGWMGHEEELRAFGRGFAWLAIVPAMLFALYLGVRSDEGSPTHAVLFVLLGSMLATLFLYLGDPRLRVPFDPLIAAFGADAWRRALAAVRGRQGAAA